MHYPETPPQDNRLPGLLLRTAFYQCCETTRVHFMVLGHINRTTWGTNCSSWQSAWASLVDCRNLCNLLKAQHYSLNPNGYFNPPLALHPLRPSHPLLPPIDSIRDITGTEKNYLKNQQHLNSL